MQTWAQNAPTILNHSDTEWPTRGSNLLNQHYSPLGQINSDNFSDLERTWLWRGDNFGTSIEYTMRATPIYAGGKIFTVAGNRRTVVAIDPITGETLWTFREPPTVRWEKSPRKSYGRGVSYAQVNGKGVIYVVTAAFFLHALDAETGIPLEEFGSAISLYGFPTSGSVDLLADLGYPYDPDKGIPDDLGYITNSSPPLVVNGVVIVGSSGHNGMGGQTRIENVRGDILAYSAVTGEFLWKFNTIPQPGEYGHESWESDAWSYVGNVNAWAPLAADAERGIVYIPTDAPTNDVYGGFRPGNNLFSSSILALDIQSGERVWHYQTVHHDIWDRDNPVTPVLLDTSVNGISTPILIQVTKQGLAFTFNRETGEPIWPIVETPFPNSQVPGEVTSPTQPIPTRPAPFEIQGLRKTDLINFTPELYRLASEQLQGIRFGPLFNPPIHRGNAEGFNGAALCPGTTGGANITGGTASDPENGILYVASIKTCSRIELRPASEVDTGANEYRGRTVTDWIRAPGTSLGNINGLPLLKPPYSRITAIDMNTGEHLWWIPNGDTPDRIKNHPLLEGIDIENTGQFSHANTLVTKELLIYGEGSGGRPKLHAINKQTGESIGSIDIPASSSAPLSSFFHLGQQIIIVPISGPDHPGSVLALKLPRRI